MYLRSKPRSTQARDLETVNSRRIMTTRREEDVELKSWMSLELRSVGSEGG